MLNLLFRTHLLVIALTLSFLIGTASAQDGRKIYQQHCAKCHGQQGEGKPDAYKERLIGDWSVVELTEYIDRRMPEGEPEFCQAKDAKAVAAWMFEAFYSPAAQARNHPPQLQLARLTAQQYRNSIADIIGTFLTANDIPERERGLKAEYYDSKSFKPGNKQIERIDPQVDFNYQEESPDQKIGKDEFSAQWVGGLIAPDSGVYEIVVVTDNGIKLWLNDEDEPVVDGWVRTGDAVEHRIAVRLLGGRMYHLKLHFYKFGEKTARIQLKWKRPHHSEEVIPTRFLSPKVGGYHMVVETKFPPEDLSYGYPRATSISRAWHDATTSAAIEVADRIANRASKIKKYRVENDRNAAQLKKLATDFAQLAFRRSLNQQQLSTYVLSHFQPDVERFLALRRSILRVLKSPSFLYREIEPGTDGFDIASRLSYTLWDSVPDRQLREAAERGELNNIFQLQFQAERMVKNPRTKVKLRQFLHHWLRMDHVNDPVKDAKVYPDYDSKLLSDFRTSMDLLLDEIVWSEESDFRRLMLADHTWMNQRMFDFFGIRLKQPVKGQGPNGFIRVRFESKERAGVLSHPFLMTGFAYQATSSPIHRGVFVARNLLGRMLRPPPDAVTPLPPELHADLTTRQRTSLQTKPEVCATCHQMINPLGFPLEHFDPVGRFRKSEKNKAIDASGSYRSRTGKTVRFDGARPLADFLANSPETHQSFVKQMFHYNVQQPILAFGVQTPTELTKSFAAQKFNIRKLLAAIATRVAGHELLKQQKQKQK